MKRITVITILLAGLAVGRAPAQDHAVEATIPFGFTVGNTLLPPGTYQVITEFPNVIEIFNSKQHVEILSLVFATDENSGNNELIFDRYGNQYFLSKVL